MGKTREVIGVSNAPGGRPARGLVARFALNERGATAMEYGLIAALIAIGIIVALTTLSNSVENNLYTTIGALVVS